MTPKENNALQVRLVLDNGKFIEWQTPSETFWGLMHIVERQAGRAGWKLTDKVPEPAPATKKEAAAEPAKEKPRLN